MKQYSVYYGSTVPFKNETFKSWKDAVTFMKTQLDAGVIVRSVSKEQISKEHFGVES